MRKLIALLGRRVILSGMAVLIAGISFSVPVFAVTGPWIYAGQNYPTQAAALAAMHAVSARKALLTVQVGTPIVGTTGITYTYGAPSPVAPTQGPYHYCPTSPQLACPFTPTTTSLDQAVQYQMQASASQYNCIYTDPTIVGPWQTIGIGEDQQTYQATTAPASTTIPCSTPSSLIHISFLFGVSRIYAMSCPTYYTALNSTACTDPDTDTISCACAIPTGQTASTPVALSNTSSTFHAKYPTVNSAERFQQGLTPTGNWLGRTITEQFNGAVYDQCWYGVRDIVRYSVAQAGGPITLTNSQGLFSDDVGVDDGTILDYRLEERTPCIILQDVQSIVIDCPNAPGGTSPVFATDTITSEIGTSTVTNTRNGTSKTITFGTPQTSNPTQSLAAILYALLLGVPTAPVPAK